MSTIQHINSSLDHFWPEYQRRFPAFDKPQIVPAETLRGMSPVYMRRLIDQDPSSYYLFVRADPMRGDASRDRMVEFVDDFFYEKLGMPSSYDVEAGQGGDLPREQAVDKEVMPARDDREYQRYFDEQMAAAEAQRREQERQKRIDDLGFDPDDPDIIDAEIGDDGVARPVQGASGTTAVGPAQTTAVSMPKKIWFCVDFHCPAGGMLGYDGNSGRLDGRDRRRFLREEEGNEEDGEYGVGRYMNVGQQLLKAMRAVGNDLDKSCVSMLSPDTNRRCASFTVESFGPHAVLTLKAHESLLTAKQFLQELRDAGVKKISEISKVVDSYGNVCTKVSLDSRKCVTFLLVPVEDDMSDVKSLLREDDAPLGAALGAYKDLPDSLKKDVEQIALGDGVVVVKHKDGKFTVVEDGKAVMERVSADEVKKSGKLGKKQVTVATKDELDKTPSECDSDPEKMMKEFVEKKDSGEIGEDEYRRPKNQPHNLHRVDEEDNGKKTEDRGESDGDKAEDDGKAENESEELNESMIRFCDRLIRG